MQLFPLRVLHGLETIEMTTLSKVKSHVAYCVEDGRKQMKYLGEISISKVKN